MKFAIRDDDTCFFHSPKHLEWCYKDVWNICPISLAIVPFMKGNWPKWVDIIEKSHKRFVLDDYLNDNKVYELAANKLLISFLKERIKENKVSLCIHAIHHRNEDDVIPEFKGNYGIGAEFYTNRDLNNKLKSSIKYLNKLFSKEISVFTPPQNLLNYNGYLAIQSNKLNICMDTGSVFDYFTFKRIGFLNYIKYLIFSIQKKYIYKNSFVYPYVIKTPKHNEVAHYRLQPKTKLEELIKQFDFVKKKNGDFVLSIHNYAFDYFMKYDKSKNIKDVFMEFMKYVKSHPNIDYCTLEQLLSK